MPIIATVFSERAEVEVRGATRKAFDEDLKLLVSQIEHADLKFDEDKKVWYVYNIHKYTHLPYIKTALEHRKLSLEFQMRNINALLGVE